MTRERILIVDGDVALSTLLKTRLEALGYLVECARDGNEALEILQDTWVDLILLDVVLRGQMNGFQLFKKVKKKKALAGIPVIVQTGKVAMKKTFETMGVELFFIKPYDISVLLAEVKDMLTKKIAVFGEKHKVTESIIRHLSGYNFKTDIIRSSSKFYHSVISYRYDLIVVQYKKSPNITDRMISITRGSGKNRETPVIVYMTSKVSGLGTREVRKIRSLKERCVNLGSCEFMDKGYIKRKFAEITQSYLSSAE